MIAILDGKNMLDGHWIWDRLGEDFELKFFSGRDFSSHGLAQILKDYPIILNGSTRLSRDQSWGWIRPIT